MRTNPYKTAVTARLSAICPGYGRRNRGIALIAVIVLFSVCLTLFGLWAQSVTRERSRLATQQFRLQAVSLAETGLRRAIAQHAADPKYTGETWSVPANQLDNIHAAEVRIVVLSKPNSSEIRYSATAEFPVGGVRRVQITKSVEIPNPSKKS